MRSESTSTRASASVPERATREPRRGRIGWPADERPTPEIFKAYDIRGLYGEQIDGDVAEPIGRAFARVLGELAGKPTARAARRPRPRHAPERARAGRRATARACSAEGAHVLDAGQVGTEMLYYLVGSRELDGGLMCTASHNPKAYTGAKLVREGAIALSGDAGIQDIRALGRSRRRRRRDAGRAARVEAGRVYEEFQRRGAALHRPRRGALGARPLKVVVDGGNGMAGPMVGPLLESLGLELIETYWTPDGNFPDHEPNPLLPGEPRADHRARCARAAPTSGIAWDGDADRCFFIDETGEFVDGDFLTALLAESLLRKQPGRGDPLRRARDAAPSPTRSRRPAARRTSTASATRSSRRACARRARCSAARSPATTTSATSTAPTRARSRRC